MYKHAYVPYGKDLHCEELKLALNDIFTMVVKLAPIVNSQRNESFNSTVGSKNPKIRFYGWSESNDFRVAYAMAQTNVGYGYICRKLNSLGIEPGTNCEAYVDGMKRKRDGDNTRKIFLKFKKRRNEIHTKRIHDRNGDSCALNQSAVYKAWFDQGFDAHDALEDVKALHRILFSKLLNLSEKDLIKHCQAIPFDEAYQDNLYLNQRHQFVQTLDTKLHGTISKGMVQNRQQWLELREFTKSV
ncbi:Hypothetical predicted protein [Paramuricea clavata]|uniref:Uncharacterized protein n=1 Tax=Paramuricea clavata TaxID=317549 RepID=A0A7D9KXD2_PARCT|nr:Hypothetical predicted protein [Paramuricea clavata]